MGRHIITLKEISTCQPKNPEVIARPNYNYKNELSYHNGSGYSNIGEIQEKCLKTKNMSEDYSGHY